MKKLPWLLLPLSLGGVGANNIIACDGKEFLHKSTADQLECRLLPKPLHSRHVNGKQRSQDGAINDYHDDSIELKSESSISVRPNQTRHAPINPNTVQVEITITNDITNQLNDPPQPGLGHPSPRQAEPSAPDHDPTEALDVASYSSRTWKEVRNPAPANRVIAGMGAGLVGVMVVFTVFL